MSSGEGGIPPGQGVNGGREESPSRPPFPSLEDLSLKLAESQIVRAGRPLLLEDAVMGAPEVIPLIQKHSTYISDSLVNIEAILLTLMRAAAEGEAWAHNKLYLVCFFLFPPSSKHGAKNAPHSHTHTPFFACSSRGMVGRRQLSLSRTVSANSCTGL